MDGSVWDVVAVIDNKTHKLLWLALNQLAEWTRGVVSSVVIDGRNYYDPQGVAELVGLTKDSTKAALREMHKLGMVDRKGVIAEGAGYEGRDAIVYHYAATTSVPIQMDDEKGMAELPVEEP